MTHAQRLSVHVVLLARAPAEGRALAHTVTLTACRSGVLSDPERLDLLDALCRLHLLQIGAFMLLIYVLTFFYVRS